VEAFLIRIEDSRHQEYVQKNPFLLGPDIALNRELGEAWQAHLDIRKPPRVPFRHEEFQVPLDALVTRRDWEAIVSAHASVGLDEKAARGAVNAWGWKMVRAPRGARRILSIGCAFGQELVVLRALFPEAELDGVDYDMAVSTDWRKALRLGELKSQPIEDYLSSHRGAFDLVFSNHTLEHLSAPDRTLRLIRDALVPGGVCVSALPLEGDESNPFYGDLSRIAEGHGRVDPQLDLEFINPGHAWKTNREDLAATFYASGFRDISMFTRANYPAYVHRGHHTPWHVSTFQPRRIVGKWLERVTLRPLRLGLRRMYPDEIPQSAVKMYYRVAGRCWFSRLRLLHALMHETVVVAR
jgi:SAM-dependent methyltransferase